MIGILGGMSWESTLTYYREINRRYHERLGGHHSAPIVLYSVDFAPVEAMQRAGAWDRAGEELARAGRSLEYAGATVIVMATNTMHLVFDELVAATRVPWLHIADAAAERLLADGRRRVGLLGTRFTMERTFYRRRIESHSPLDVVVPAEVDRAEIDRIIFEELVHGVVREESRAFIAAEIERCAEAGCDAVILGCTELGMFGLAGSDQAAAPAGDVNNPDTDPSRRAALPLLDTTLVHADAAVEAYLARR